MNTVEKNKIIAKFMGHEEPFDIPEHGYIRGSMTWTTVFAASELKYSHSWNWLIPVVEEIAKRENVSLLGAFNVLKKDMKDGYKIENFKDLYDEVVHYILKYHSED